MGHKPTLEETGAEPSASCSFIRSKSKDERGIILVWCGMTMVVLMGFCGFSVDLGNWYLHILRAQHAADAASLAGGALLPQDPLAARNAARDALTRNRMSSTDVAAAYGNTNCVDKNPCIQPIGGEMKVQVNTTVDNAFLGILGLSKSNSFVRGAIASQTPGLKFGDLSNALGFEPDNGIDGVWQDNAVRNDPYGEPYQRYWLSIAGQLTQKAQGDRYANRRCSGDSNATGLISGQVTDYCPSAGTNNPDTNNQEYQYEAPAGKPTQGVSPGSNPQYGYWFDITVDKNVIGNKLGVEVYDPAFVRVERNGNCIDNNPPASMRSKETCAVDGMDGYQRGSITQTRYRLYKKSNLTSPIAGCDKTFDGWDGLNISSVLNTTETKNGYRLRDLFQRWVNICYADIDPTKVNEYTMRVTTNSSNGGNHFSLRAGTFSAPNRANFLKAESNNSVSISVSKSFSILNAYEANTNVRFALTRVSEAYAGKTIAFDAYDIGDTGVDHNGNSINPNTNQLISITSSADVNPNPTNNAWICNYSKPFGTTYNLGTTRAGACRFNVNRTNYNGKIVRLEFTIPTNYTCDDTSVLGCWIFVNMRFTAAADDVSTWDLAQPGTPLHLSQ